MADEQLLGKPVSELGLSVRPRICLERLGINTLGELVQRSAAELLEAPNFGILSLAEVREKLARYGLSLRGD
jgi:DNA-directed RNA polymerase subunit alpha